MCLGLGSVTLLHICYNVDKVKVLLGLLREGTNLHFHNLSGRVVWTELVTSTVEYVNITHTRTWATYVTNHYNLRH